MLLVALTRSGKLLVMRGQEQFLMFEK